MHKQYFSKFDRVTNLEVSQYFYFWIFDNYQFDHFTLDIDSSLLTSYGNDAVGTKKGL